jgi:hypothetical protein
MKVIAKRNFLRSAVNGKRDHFKKGETYEVSPEEFKEMGLFGLVPVKDEKKEDKK